MILQWFPAAAPTKSTNVWITGLSGDTDSRSVQVTWDTPVNAQFDVAYYRVQTFVVGKDEYVEGNTTSNSIQLEVAFKLGGEIRARVYTVSRCNEESEPAISTESVPAASPGE